MAEAGTTLAHGRQVYLMQSVGSSDTYILEGGEKIKSDVQIQLSTHVVGPQTPLFMLCLGVHPHYKIKAKCYDLLSTDGAIPPEKPQ